MRPERGLLLLATSFGLAWVSIAMIAAPGPAALVELSGRAGDAGLFFAVFALASAAGGAVTGRLMDRFGRRSPLAGAHATAAVGFAAAGIAYRAGSFAGFLAADALMAFGVGGVYLTRVAAGEMFPPRERARAVARVQVAAALAAVAGPLVLLALAARAKELVWVVAPPIYLASALLVAFWRAPPPAPATSGTSATGAGRIPRAPFLLGLVALLCAQGAMITIMGVTGVELHHAGHTPLATALVMSLHFLGMFGLSLVVGRVTDRLGRRVTVLAGVAVLAAGGATVAFAPGAVGLAGGLLLVGLGWSFAYIAGTVLLTDILPAARRARTIGLVDLATALAAALASWVGGLWYAERGIAGLGLAAAAIALLPVLFSAGLREATPGHYEGVEAEGA